MIDTILARPRTTALVAALVASLQLAAHAANAPTVTTGSATGIAATSVTLNGVVDPNGTSAHPQFAYGSTTAYGSSITGSPGRVGGSSGPTGVTASLSGLECGTTYHYRMTASSRSGSGTGGDMAFTTSACQQPASTPPTANSSAATAIAATSATMNGAVTAGSATATVTFEWGTTGTYGTSVSATPSTVAAGASANPAASLSGLTCGTTYHYRIKALSSVSYAFGADTAFTTSACQQTTTPPTATTNAASAIATTSATLNGVVVAGSAQATVAFDWGSTTAYGTSVAGTPASIATGGSANATAALSGLACGTTYHYRIKASSSVSTANGADQSFATSACSTGTTGSSPPATTPVAVNWPWPIWTGQAITVPASSTGNTYYVDGTNGNDANAGTSTAAAFRTVAKAVAKVVAGDTVLIRKGLYREGIHLVGVAGTAAKPITFGSYGDGAAILDGSTRVTGWVNVGGSVWRAPVSFTPIGVVVNDVPLKQVRQGQNGSSAPQDGLAGVTNGSGKWYVGGGSITADFGPVLGSGDPNTADIVVPNNNGGQEHVYWYHSAHLVFQGLTVRGSGSNGLWGYGSNVSVIDCDIKFNGKAAVSFLSESGTPNADNVVIRSHAYQNVLLNWPRGNNGYAEAGGGWPGTVVWQNALRPVARGNLVHMNGGEGIISYGTAASNGPTGSALFEQNVAYDNWSVNMYFDNQPNDVARNNFLSNHAYDPSLFLYVGNYPYDSLGKYSVCIMLADEQWSSDSTNNYANLSGTRVYDNLIAGCRIGIRDYSEGSSAQAWHGLKDTWIVNNTILMPFTQIPNVPTYGIYLQDNKTPSGTQRNANSLIENNVVYGYNQDALFFTELTGSQGVTIDYNDYYSTATKPFGSGYNTVSFYAFPGWRTAIPGADGNSKFADPLLLDLTAFRAVGPTPYDYAKAALQAGSPAANAGTAQSFSPANNIAGAARSTWNIGAF